MQTLITNFASGKRRAYMVIIVIFITTILFSSNFECTCRSQVLDCSKKSGKCPRFFCSFIRHFSKKFLFSLLWAAYVCCLRNLSNRTQEALLPCKDKWKLTFEERLHITEQRVQGQCFSFFLHIMFFNL